MITRRSVFALFLVLSSVGMMARPALAGAPDFFAPNGIAIHGYDPVAYFTEGRPVEGKKDHALKWGGAIWYFASAAHMADFEGNPRRYAPQYGGYCALALSKGQIATTVPEAWTVANGRLYLNFSTGVRSLWASDIEGNVAAADGNWPDALKK